VKEKHASTHRKRSAQRRLSGDLKSDVIPAHWFGLNLFWRTFFMLSLLMAGCILTSIQVARALHFEPLTQQTARQIASFVNMVRVALVHAQPTERASLAQLMAKQEKLYIQPSRADDYFEPLKPPAPLSSRLGQDIAHYLGEGTVVAGRVNGTKGLWVSLSLQGKDGTKHWWLHMDEARMQASRDNIWLIWLCTVGTLSLSGAALIARFLNRPLKRLSYAADRVRDGDFENSHLDETVITSEIRTVNVEFNSMAQKLAKLEEDRMVMLAGISHDLRTPLSRLRLETELSVKDPVAQGHMVADIVQLDAIIDKFLEYVRPGDEKKMAPVNLYHVVTSCIYAMQNAREVQAFLQIPIDIYVLADEIELARVISNLLENARRYGKDTNGNTRIDIIARMYKEVVQMRLRDYGPGVEHEQLAHLVKPFFRSDSARTAATGSGLGLSIVDKTVRRMGGKLALKNSSTGGLVAYIKLKNASLAAAAQMPSQRLQRPAIQRQLKPHGAL